MVATRDLGEFAGPALICGGAYANLEAWSAMMRTARERAIPPARIVHAGDVVAYCADPVATAEALRASGAHAIAGNVEIQLAADAEDCGCGFEDGSACAAMSHAWYGWARRALAGHDALIAWMGSLADRLVFTMQGMRFHVLHGAASSVNGRVFASSPRQILEREMALVGDDVDVVIAGHCGLPFTRRLDGRTWHNTGALGMPANDGTPRVWLSIVEPVGDGVRLEHVPIGYDHDAASAKMRAAGLPAGYADALRSGLWPSLDTLPPQERRRTGQPIEPTLHHLMSTRSRDRKIRSA